MLYITGYAENAVVGKGRLDPRQQAIAKLFAMAALGAGVRETIGG